MEPQVTQHGDGGMIRRAGRLRAAFLPPHVRDPTGGVRGRRFHYNEAHGPQQRDRIAEVRTPLTGSDSAGRRAARSS